MLNNTNVLERIEYLCNVLNKANVEYYVNDNPTITDQEYDDYYHELETLEKKYPQFIKEDSPTKRVGGTVIDEFPLAYCIPLPSLSAKVAILSIKALNLSVLATLTP